MKKFGRNVVHAVLVLTGLCTVGDLWAEVRLIPQLKFAAYGCVPHGSYANQVITTRRRVGIQSRR
jgi:hypothetical protein